MLFKEAVSERILELIKIQGYPSTNKVAEMSTVPPSTLRAMLANQVENPSSYVIYKVCKLFKIELKDFYDSELFKYSNLDD